MKDSLGNVIPTRKQMQAHVAGCAQCTEAFEMVEALTDDHGNCPINLYDHEGEYLPDEPKAALVTVSKNGSVPGYVCDAYCKMAEIRADAVEIDGLKLTR